MLRLSLSEFLFQNIHCQTAGRHSYLLRLTYQGLLQRYNGASKEEAEKLDLAGLFEAIDGFIERAEMELGVMGNMGYEGYFLIVRFISRENQELFWSGVVARLVSIVAYALDITDLDPLKIWF